MEKLDFFAEDRVTALNDIRAYGIDPYPYNYTADSRAYDIKNRFETCDEKQVSLSGRIVGIRKHGKAVFMDLRDSSGDIQLFMRSNELEAISKEKTNLWELLKLLHLGDIIGVTGNVFKTRMGEISIMVKDFDLLSKCLFDIPFGKQKGEDNWYSVTDPAVQYKERYIFWSVYPEAADKMRKRAVIINEIRNLMNARDFLEVQTPSIELVYGGAEARPFVVDIWALDHQKAYLRISPELYLKRYIAGGFPKVYTICQNFRNEGIDRSHNPEFSMIEWYEAFTDYEFQMKQVEEIVSLVAIKACGSAKIVFQDNEIDFTPPWQRLSMLDAVRKYAGFDISSATENDVKEFFSQKEMGLPEPYNWGIAVQRLYEDFCEDKITQPTFIIDHPKESSPLCKLKRGDDRLIERFEPVVAGMELGNAYSELTDPLAQIEKFKEQGKIRSKEEIAHHPVDIDYIKALACGLPPTGGVGIGIDRLVMLLTDSQSIRDVIPFPMMRPGE